MGIFSNLFNRTDINTAVEEYRNNPGAYLIDVRTGPEYEAGHIEGSINVPLHSIHFIVNHVRDIEAPLYVYCQSGARSGQATSMIKEMGFKNVKNIGGVNRYKGTLVR
ncbi:MAG TPA: rhodanese-like domain-containing protein [Lachnospiraceae bacterium]|nr:rhodanese-like domain-containing protein [Lachnospiraceae bacterium]